MRKLVFSLVVVGAFVAACSAPSSTTATDATRHHHHPTTTTTRPRTTTTQPATTTTGSTIPATTTTGPVTTTQPTTGLWKPTSTHSLGFQWVLGAALNLNSPADMGTKDFNGNTLPSPDIFDIDGEYNPASTVAALHTLGKKVICYMDAGVYETYRTDASSFPKSVIGSADAGWNGSFWLDVRQVAILQPIMQARIANCKAKGFDAVEPDEIDGYSNNPGFPITGAQQETYNKDFASWAHAAGMSVLLKGDIDQAVDLQPSFDFSLNEECGRYKECSPGLDAFSNADKAVFIAEYRTQDLTAAMCTSYVAKHWNASLYKLGLPEGNQAVRQPCVGSF